jgi:peptidoglycan hydrolase CwlO-like protein
MALEDTELKIGEVNLKGIWIAVFLSAATTVGGGIWAASEFYSRIVALEDSASDTSSIKTKMTEVTTNLRTIIEQQKKMSDIKDKMNDLEKQMQEASLKVDAFEKQAQGLDEVITRLNREIDDLWKGLDAASNPLR